MNISRSLVNVHVLFHLRRLLSGYPFEIDIIRSLQLTRLRRILIHAYEHFDFYRERMDGSGLDPYRITSVSEIRKLPVLTEADYREFADSEYDKDPSRYASYFFDSTSGTTGIKFRIVRTWPERGYMIAKFLRPLFLNGLRWNDRIFRIIAPTRIPRKQDSILQYLGIFQRSLMDFYASPGEMALRYQEMQPDFFYANKQQVLLTALYLLENNLPFRKPRIYSSAADVIDENCRQLFYRAFGDNNFFETYGSNELGNLGFQIKGQQGMHFCHDTNILELQAADGTNSEDEGNCLITDLGIFSFPMIRFQLGDYLETFEDEKGVRKIRKVWGRLHDFLTWEDGSITSFAKIYRAMGNFSSEICQFQFIREKSDLVRVKAVPAPGTMVSSQRKEEVGRSLAMILKNEIRENIEYHVEFVPLIEAGKNGKVKMVINNLDEQ